MAGGMTPPQRCGSNTSYRTSQSLEALAVVRSCQKLPIKKNGTVQRGRPLSERERNGGEKRAYRWTRNNNTPYMSQKAESKNFSSLRSCNLIAVRCLGLGKSCKVD